MTKTFTMWGPTSIDHFKNLHDYYLKKNHIVHVYAEPTFYLRRDSDESKWYYRMLREKELVYKFMVDKFYKKLSNNEKVYIFVNPRVHTSAQIDTEMERGSELGYFSFGGSSIITLFQPNKVQLDSELSKMTNTGYESYAKMGEIMANVIHE